MKFLTMMIGILLVMPMTGWSQKRESKFIREGNREFEKQNFEDSEVLYRKALEESRVPYRSTFNIGDALYKQKKFENAVNQFENLTEMAPDKNAKSRTFHNLGNALLQNQKIEESIEAYKEALRNNPTDLETKYNLAYAKNLLEQQQQNQQQNQDQNQDQENQDQNQDQNQNQENQDQNQNQENQDQNQNQENQDQQQNQQPQPNQLSKDDAQRILQALQNQENEVQDKVKKAKAAKTRVKTAINW